MNVDLSWTRSLNHWGLNHSALVTFLGNDLVYVVLAIAAIWIAQYELRLKTSAVSQIQFLRTAIKNSIVMFALPLAISVALSEGLSAVINRSRPFAAHNDITLVFPHDPDGGMPSHHILFMVALAACILPLQKRLGTLLILLSLISGVARVAAGIHYPTDIAVGAVLGFVTVLSYQKALGFLPRLRMKP